MSIERLWYEYLDAAGRELDRERFVAPSAFPHFTEAGRWFRLSVDALSRWTDNGVYEHGNWTAGFWFGVMWLRALGSDDQRARDLASGRLEYLAPRAADATTHDLGFLFYPSAVFGDLAGFDADLHPAFSAAEMLVRRFNTRGNYIQAFGSIGHSLSAGTNTIDTMMNLPLLWWRAGAAGDPVFFEVARQHARTSARLFLRPDASTFHLIRFDPVSGALVQRGTFQGAHSDSCWSRGQAWAITGFAWAFAATGEPEFLEAAERTLTYFAERTPANGVPSWDFADRAPDATRDASATAIASVGALILGEVHPDSACRERFWMLGCDLLARVGESALNRDARQEGILLESCYSKPHGLGVRGATAWGDFFFGLGLALASKTMSFASISGFGRGHLAAGANLDKEDG